MGVDRTCTPESIDARAAGGDRPWVVKLGGSLVRSKMLKRWLEAVAASELPIVIVPGGGPFADQVRDAQRRWRFDDGTAHAMAVLAMEQFGRLLAALEPRLKLCATREELLNTLKVGRGAVWLPQAMTLGSPEIEESWDVTSDSLAAWLAGKLRARGLVLVKSAELPASSASADELCRLGLIDSALGGFLKAAMIDAWCVGADQHAVAIESLLAGRGPGIAIVSGQAQPA